MADQPRYLVEVCATNLASVLAAGRAGAQRIELCSALDAGGLTPSFGLIRAALQTVRIPIYVLIRPREGDFCYSPGELALMLDDIRTCRTIGVPGVVIGALQANGRLHLPQLAALVEAAAGMDITCHRAFDFTPDPVESLEELVRLGIRRVLSSGQAATAEAGQILLKKMVKQAAGRLSIMPGGGISAANIGRIAATSQAREFHFTAKIKVSSAQATILPGLENGYWQSDEIRIRDTIAALNT